MLPFVVLLFVPIMLQHLVADKNNVDFEKKNKNALLFFFAFLTLLIMLRHESVGTDTKTYGYLFHKFSLMNWDAVRKDSIEVGFSYFNKLISLFTSDIQIYFAVVAIALIALIYPTYKRLCVDASLTVVLFCTMSTFVMLFSGIRQMLAVGIGFLAYECTRQKKLVPFILCVTLAVLFHTSAFMLVLMYPLYHAKITKKWLIVVVPVILLTFVFNRQIFSVLALFLERYTDYDASMVQTGAYAMLILFALFAAFCFVVPLDNELDDEVIGLRNFLLLALVIQMFAPLHTIAMRMNYYYIIFIPLLLPKIIENKSERWGDVVVWSRRVMVWFFLVYFFWNAAGGGNLKVFPYHFFWEQI